MGPDQAPGHQRTLLHNATVWFGENALPEKGWLEILGNRIASVGRGKLPDSPNNVDAIDLNGAHLLPGFVDCHSHLTVSAWIPCSIHGAGWTSKKDLLDALRRRASISEETDWLIVFYADFHRIGRLPSMQELNEACLGRPVIVNDYSLHQCLANESAFSRANIASLSFPVNDVVLKNGQPTGLLQEAASGHMLSIALQQLAGQLESISALALLEAEAARHLAMGITACHDPCVHPKMQAAMERLQTRTPLRLSWSHVKSSENADYVVDELCLSCGAGPKSAKVFLDGAKQCAICLDPGDVMKLTSYAVGSALKGDLSSLRTLTSTTLAYKNQKFVTPYLRLSPNEIRKTLDDIGEADARPKIHAIGNEAVKCACQALKQTGTKNSSIEHLILLTNNDIEAVTDCAAIASLQPGFLNQSEELVSSKMEKVMNIIPARSLIDAGVPTALSSDNPCGPLDPLGNIRSAVNRRSDRGFIIDKKEAITISEAVRAYSVTGHHAIHGKPHKGLSVGEIADLVILNSSPENPAARVLSTWVDGIEVYTQGVFRRRTYRP
ncbi:amidohydrolase [Marinobacter sp.]|uniref:amidohydrolase n=1 Tax=Marinobacter sp. TaxID=50741 RepID=UPI003A8E2EB0